MLIYTKFILQVKYGWYQGRDLIQTMYIDLCWDGLLGMVPNVFPFITRLLVFDLIGSVHNQRGKKKVSNVIKMEVGRKTLKTNIFVGKL